MIKCEICGRTIDEIVDQDGSVTIQEDMPLVCDRYQQKEQFDKQIEILRKVIDCNKIGCQFIRQQEAWEQLKKENKKLCKALKREKQKKFFTQSDINIKENVVKKIKKLQLQLKELNTRWNKLKKWLNLYIQFQEKLKITNSKFCGNYITGNIIDVNDVLKKMDDLEKGEKDGTNNTI